MRTESHQTDAFAIMNARMVDDSSKARVITAVQEVLGKANVKVYPYYYADDDRSRPSQDANDGNAQGLGDRLGQGKVLCSTCSYPAFAGPDCVIEKRERQTSAIKSRALYIVCCAQMLSR